MYNKKKSSWIKSASDFFKYIFYFSFSFTRKLITLVIIIKWHIGVIIKRKKNKWTKKKWYAILYGNNETRGIPDRQIKSGQLFASGDMKKLWH